MRVIFMGASARRGRVCGGEGGGKHSRDKGSSADRHGGNYRQREGVAPFLSTGVTDSVLVLPQIKYVFYPSSGIKIWFACLIYESTIKDKSDMSFRLVLKLLFADCTELISVVTEEIFHETGS